MKRNYPYTAPNPQAQAAQQPAYAQPPPPAGPAPPLPSSGPPPSGAYANYGYGAVAPPRHAAAAVNAAGTNDAQQSAWSQQWQQQPQPPYYPHQQPGVAGAPAAGQYTVPRPPALPQSASYRPMAGPNAASSAANQPAAYSPHQPQQQSLPYSYPAQASPMQSQSPSQHHQPPGPPSYGYNVSVSQHQNPAPSSGGAQNWPGAYAAGSQVGPPNKKPRYQASSAPGPSPAPPYIPPSTAPIPPIGGNLAGSALNQYPGQAQPLSQYPWQAPHAAPAPYMNPRPPAAVGSGVYAGTQGRAGLSAHPAKGDKGKRGSGNNTASGNTGGSRLNRNGAQSRGNTPRAGLPVNPAASVNSIRAQNGSAPAWGAQANVGQHRASAETGAGSQAGRRASASSSVHSDRNGGRADNPKAPGGGPVKMPGFSSQNMIPINAPRGPNGVRSKSGKTNSDKRTTTPQSLKGGTADSAQDARGAGVFPQNANATHAGVGDAAVTETSAAAAASAKDGGASSKRAHTDFRILGLEIRELEWSWFAAQALAKDPIGADAVKDEDADSKLYLGQIKVEPSELPAVPAPGAQIGDESRGKAALHVEARQNADSTASAGHDAEAVQAIGDETGDIEADALDEQGRDAGEHVHPGEAKKDTGIADPCEHQADAEGDADDDADGEVDDDLDAEADADAEVDGAAAAAAAAEPRSQADDEEDITLPHTDADTVTSNTQLSVAPTPEPESSDSSPKGPKAEVDQASALNGKAVKAERARTVVNLRESTKLRLCFAAMSNAGPEGAPTGPKATQNQGSIVDTETSIQDHKIEAQPEQKSAVDEQRSSESATAAERETKEKTDLEGVSKQEVSTTELSVGSTADTTEAHVAERDLSAASQALEPSESPVEGVSTKEPARPAEIDAAAPAEAANEMQREKPKAQVEEAETSKKDHQTDDVVTPSTMAKKTRSDGGDVVPHAKGPPQLSLNRIFLSYAANRKRLAIDAEAVHSVKINRSEHWVEICIDTSRQQSQTRKKGEEYLVCNGTLLEKRTKGQENYTAVTRSEIAAAWEVGDAVVQDPETTEATDNEGSDDGYLELPPFPRLEPSASTLTLFVHLDPSAPLPEPAWLRKNDVNSLLANLQRGSSAIAGRSETAISVATAQHVWAGKIEVVDPDPPPCMSTFLYDWVKESFIGSQKERRKFIDELLKGSIRQGQLEVTGESEGGIEDGASATEEVKTEGERERDVSVARAFVEIVLRLVKGERAPVTPATSASGDSSLVRALASTSFTSTTTYPGLVMLGLLDLALDNPASDPAATRAQVDKLLMQIPHATLFKAVDLTWKDVVDVGRKGTVSSAGTTGGSRTTEKPVAASRPNRHHHHHHHGQPQNRFHQSNRQPKRKRA